VAELEDARPRQRQYVVRVGLGDRVILVKAQVVVGRGRGRYEGIVDVVVAFELVRDRAMQGDIERLAGRGELLREAQRRVVVVLGIVPARDTPRRAGHRTGGVEAVVELGIGTQPAALAPARRGRERLA